MGYLLSLSKATTEQWLGASELSLLICGLVLAVGAAGEYLEDHRKLPVWMKWSRQPKLVFVWMVALSLIGEFVGDAGVFVFSGHLQTIADQELSDLGSDAAQLESRLKIVGDKANQAEGASGTASTKSTEAVTASGNALSLARGARTEADSFEKDIVSAKQQAADAESHLAEALRRAADATAAFDRIKLPRTLMNIPRLLSALQPFSGTEYVFSAVYSDEESLSLLKSIEDVLQRAGWKRAKSIGGFPSININGTKDPSFSVPVALTDGIRVQAESPNAPFADNAALDSLPTNVRAAVIMNIALSSSVSPPEPPINVLGDPHPVNVVKGDSVVIRISVGKKPIAP